MADGTIPENQQKRLEALGHWLDVNGESMFDTRPWTRAEGKTTQGTDIRFTQSDNALYATLLDTPSEHDITIEGLTIDSGARVRLLGHDADLTWTQSGSDLSIQLPALPDSPAHSLQII